jgi:hypothetical protein
MDRHNQLRGGPAGGAAVAAQVGDATRQPVRLGAELHVFDEDPAGLLETAHLLDEQCGLAVHYSWTKRTKMLPALASARGPTIALIELQSEQVDYGNFSGLRIIETIKRNPLLRARCHPVALTVHGQTEAHRAIRWSGARAVISKHDLQRGDGGRTREFLESLVSEPPGRPAFHVVPGSAVADALAVREREREEPELAAMLRTMPKIVGRPYFWDIVVWLALTGEPRSAARWASEEYGVTQRAVENEIAALRPALPLVYVLRGTKWSRFATDLLRCLPLRRIPPTLAELKRALPSIDAIAEYLGLPDIRARSFADEDALTAIDRLIPKHANWFERGGHVAHSRQAELIDEQLMLAEPSDKTVRGALERDFVRGIWAICDTARELDP